MRCTRCVAPLRLRVRRAGGGELFSTATQYPADSAPILLAKSIPLLCYLKFVGIIIRMGVWFSSRSATLCGQHAHCFAQRLATVFLARLRVQTRGS